MWNEYGITDYARDVFFLNVSKDNIKNLLKKEIVSRNL